MIFNPSEELIAANVRRDELQAAYDGFTQRIQDYEQQLEKLENNDLPTAEGAYRAALTKEVLDESAANRTAVRNAKKAWDGLQNVRQETRDILEATRQTHKKTKGELEQAIHTANREVAKVLREGSVKYRIEALNQVESVITQYITAYRLANNGSPAGFEGPIERLLSSYGDNFKESIKLAADIRRGLERAVNADPVTTEGGS